MYQVEWWLGPRKSQAMQCLVWRGKLHEWHFLLTQTIPSSRIACLAVYLEAASAFAITPASPVCLFGVHPRFLRFVHNGDMRTPCCSFRRQWEDIGLHGRLFVPLRSSLAFPNTLLARLHHFIKCLQLPKKCPNSYNRLNSAIVPWRSCSSTPTNLPCTTQN